MKKYLIYTRFYLIGVYCAIDEQSAKDLCAQDAGYRDEKHMNDRLEKNWDLLVKELDINLEV